MIDELSVHGLSDHGFSRFLRRKYVLLHQLLQLGDKLAPHKLWDVELNLLPLA